MMSTPPLLYFVDVRRPDPQPLPDPSSEILRFIGALNRAIDIIETGGQSRRGDTIRFLRGPQWVDFHSDCSALRVHFSDGDPDLWFHASLIALGDTLTDGGRLPILAKVEELLDHLHQALSAQAPFSEDAVAAPYQDCIDLLLMQTGEGRVEFTAPSIEAAAPARCAVTLGNEKSFALSPALWRYATTAMRASAVLSLRPQSLDLSSLSIDRWIKPPNAIRALDLASGIDQNGGAGIIHLAA